MTPIEILTDYRDRHHFFGVRIYHPSAGGENWWMPKTAINFSLLKFNQSWVGWIERDIDTPEDLPKNWWVGV